MSRGEKWGPASSAVGSCPASGRWASPRTACSGSVMARPARRPRARSCGSSASAIQDPWKPDGTPRGSVTAATGRPATSVASRTSSCDALPSRRVVIVSSQPSSSARPAAAVGTNTASPATVSAPTACSVTTPVAASNLTMPAAFAGVRDRVPVARVAADALVVHGRELDGPVRQRRLRHGTGRRVEHPAVQPGGAGGGRGGGVTGRVVAQVVPHRHGVGGGVAGGVEDDPARVVGVGVADVEDVRRVDVEPPRLTGSVQRHHAEPGAVGVVPAVGHAGGEALEREGHRQVEEDGVPVGDREVVHHRRAGPGDLRAGHELARGRELVVGEERRCEAVAEEVQLPGGRVGLGVGRHRGGEATAEVAGAHGAQLGSQHVREAALHERHDPPGVRDDVGVRDADGAVDPLRPEHRLARQRLRAHPAVAVPLRPALPQPDPVHHAVPGEPVRGRCARQRVGAVAQVPAGELGRQHPLDRQVDGVDLIGDRGEVPGHVHGDGGGGHGSSMPLRWSNSTPPSPPLTASLALRYTNAAFRYTAPVHHAQNSQVHAAASASASWLGDTPFSAAILATGLPSPASSPVASGNHGMNAMFSRSQWSRTSLAARSARL